MLSPPKTACSPRSRVPTWKCCWSSTRNSPTSCSARSCACSRPAARHQRQPSHLPRHVDVLMALDTAIIPCGGLGRRLRPITNWVPKEMLPIGLKPALYWALDEAASAGLLRVILVRDAAQAGHRGGGAAVPGPARTRVRAADRLSRAGRRDPVGTRCARRLAVPAAATRPALRRAESHHRRARRVPRVTPYHRGPRRDRQGGGGAHRRARSRTDARPGRSGGMLVDVARCARIEPRPVRRRGRTGARAHRTGGL